MNKLFMLLSCFYFFLVSWAFFKHEVSVNVLNPILYELVKIQYLRVLFVNGMLCTILSICLGAVGSKSDAYKFVCCIFSQHLILSTRSIRVFCQKQTHGCSDAKKKNARVPYRQILTKFICKYNNILMYHLQFPKIAMWIFNLVR